MYFWASNLLFSGTRGTLEIRIFFMRQTCDLCSSAYVYNNTISLCMQASLIKTELELHIMLSCHCDKVNNQDCKQFLNLNSTKKHHKNLSLEHNLRIQKGDYECWSLPYFFHCNYYKKFIWHHLPPNDQTNTSSIINTILYHIKRDIHEICDNTCRQECLGLQSWLIPGEIFHLQDNCRKIPINSMSEENETRGKIKCAKKIPWR